MGGQPFQVTGHAAADAERADRDHGHRDRDDGGVLGRPGQQEPGDGEQRDAAAGGGGSGRHREQQPAAQRAGYRQQPQQRRPPVPGQAAGHGPGGHGPAAVTSAPTRRDAVSGRLPSRVMTWLAPAPGCRWVATRIV